MPTRKKKKKEPTLSPFTQITNIMPDSDKGLDKFNQMADVNINGSSEGSVSMGESLKQADIDVIQSEIIKNTVDYMMSQGFDENEALAYSAFEFEDEGDRFYIEVRCDGFGYDSMLELSSNLDNIIIKYDKYAYFDMDYPGIISAYIDKNSPVIETLKRIDKFNESYELQTLYEMNQSKLTSQDKQKLKKFVDKTEDMEEIETYMRGLMYKDKSKDIRKGTNNATI